MGNQPEEGKEPFRIEEIPAPEETLSPEQAEEAQGGIIIIGGALRTPIFRPGITDSQSCAGSGCSPDTQKPRP